MCTVCYLWFIACSLLMTNASILNDLQEAQKFMEQLDYDYSAVVANAAAAQQRPVADLLWYDYGGGGSGSVGGGGSGDSTSGVGYYGTGSPATGTSTAWVFGADMRGGSTQASNGGIWFGPRLGRRKRRGGPTFGNAGVARSVDGNAIAPAASSLLQQDLSAMGSTSAAGQAAVSDLINNVPWVLVPIIDNTLYSQMQMKQNARNGRSSEENDDDDDIPSRSRHTARSPPYSPPFSPRLGRQAITSRPQVPRLGRETLLYRRDARNALYQRPNATLLRQQQQRLQASPLQAATESAAARRQAV